MLQSKYVLQETQQPLTICNLACPYAPRQPNPKGVGRLVGYSSSRRAGEDQGSRGDKVQCLQVLGFRQWQLLINDIFMHKFARRHRQRQRELQMVRECRRNYVPCFVFIPEPPSPFLVFVSYIIPSEYGTVLLHTPSFSQAVRQYHWGVLSCFLLLFVNTFHRAHRV